MMRLELATAWSQDEAGCFWPRAALELPLLSWSDTTGQEGHAAPFTILALVDAAGYQAILDHPDYGAGAVLWSETL
jgi:hypothetical protein